MWSAKMRAKLEDIDLPRNVRLMAFQFALNAPVSAALQPWAVRWITAMTDFALAPLPEGECCWQALAAELVPFGWACGACLAFFVDVEVWGGGALGVPESGAKLLVLVLFCFLLNFLVCSLSLSLAVLLAACCEGPDKR